LVCHFGGVVNMLMFIDLRPDYPLLLTLLESAYPSAPTWSYIARLSSARTILASLIRHNRPVPDTRFYANFSPSTFAPSASESTWGLTPARAWLREFQLHADKQLMPAVEKQCANLSRSTEFDYREWATSVSVASAEYAVVGAICCWRLSAAEFEEGIVFRLCGHSVACLFADSLGKSDQIKSDQIRRSTSCLRAEEP
jgi:hypothetical protein